MRECAPTIIAITPLPNYALIAAFLPTRSSFACGAQVAVELEVGSGTTEGAQYFSFENPKLYAKSIVLVGYGNTINDWNRCVST